MDQRVCVSFLDANVIPLPEEHWGEATRIQTGSGGYAHRCARTDTKNRLVPVPSPGSCGDGPPAGRSVGIDSAMCSQPSVQGQVRSLDRGDSTGGDGAEI